MLIKFIFLILTDTIQDFANSMTTIFEHSEYENRIEIIDQIERCRYSIKTANSVTPVPVHQNRIQYPVDTAVEVTTGALSLSNKEIVHIRDNDDSILAKVQTNERFSLSEGEYLFDVSTSIKIYIYIESTVHIYTDIDQTHIEFGDPTKVVIGARSYHTRPAGTIKSPATPTDLMRAVSSFGSALKALGPERSYPTLRGHPPAIETSEKLHIPEEFEQPDTGVRIEIPSTLDHVFTVAPLAYYLGADIRPGSEPRLSTQGGFSYTISDNGGFEERVERIVNHVFFLDCIVRTEGQAPSPLHERQAVESTIELDIPTVYEQSLAEQLEAYLTDVPFSVTDQHRQNLSHKAYLKPDSESAEFLPFVVDNLMAIRVQEQQPYRPSQERTVTDGEFDSDSVDSNWEDDFTPNESSVESVRSSIPVIQQSWKTDESTVISGTTPLAAFHNSTDREPKDGPIEIVVVCNDQSMREELVTVYSTYGNRSELPFDVTVHHDLTTDELESVLKRESDFLHYIGHIDTDGFRCSDGKLNVSSIKSIGTKVFFLNACQSYEQGLSLIEGGSIGGIVTLTDIQNTDAVCVGKTVARLLNRGYPLYAAVNIVRLNSDSGDQYHIVGDGLISFAQSTSAPSMYSIDTKSTTMNIEITYYALRNWWNGCIVTPYLEYIEPYYLAPNKVGPISITKPQLARALEQEAIPVFIDGTLKWSDEIRLREIEAM